MSFLKISDPTKRDRIVEEFLKTRKNIIQNFRSEKLGDIGLQRELTKLYKPITDVGKLQLTETKELSDTISKQQLPAIQFPRYPSIQAKLDDSADEERLIELGPIATEYLRSMASKTPSDKTFGLHDEDGKFYIGDSEVTIDGDDIIIGDETFAGTPGLWELITSKNPNATIYTIGDHENYKDILLKTNAIINPSTGKVKSSSGEKYNRIIKPIYEEYLKPILSSRKTQSPMSPSLRRVPAMATLIPPSTLPPPRLPPPRLPPPRTGRGAVFLPSDPNALVKMLQVRFASYNAGNNGVVNEIVAICDELLRQGVLDKEKYKTMMAQLMIQ